eukprot:COSAG02_NODE_62059_length_267_cov_0.577381_1_plen_51_part_10
MPRPGCDDVQVASRGSVWLTFLGFRGSKRYSPEGEGHQQQGQEQQGVPLVR